MTEPPFRVEGIDHVLLTVDDMAKALEFYGAVLGCPVQTRLPQFAMMQLRAGDALVDLVDISTPEGAWARTAERGRNMDHLCLAVDRFPEAELRAHLAAHGVEIVEEGQRSGARGVGPSFYVRDPAGNTVEIKGPPTAG
jgi:catechol 2,3-dioxygenase-like lactoylglutathione lyase family enzyme